MKTKYPSMFGVLAALLLVVSFIIPTNLATPSPVEAGVCKWTPIDMPGSSLARGDVANDTEVNRMAVGSDGATILAAVNVQMGPLNAPMLFNSSLMGLMWSTVPYGNLGAQWARDGGTNAVSIALGAPFPYVFDVAISPDDPAFWAVVVDFTTGVPEEVYITENAGGKWTRTRLTNATAAPYTGPVTVGAIDISVDYGGQRDVAVGMKEGAGAFVFSIFVLQTGGIGGWDLQLVDPPGVITGDIFAMKFSPSYVADGALAVVFTDSLPAVNGTFYNIALRDLDANTILTWTFPVNEEVSVTPTLSPFAWVGGFGAGALIAADIELPSDFNGQAASLRRAYISTDDAFTAGAGTQETGIFRFDNTTVYYLFTTTGVDNRVSSISYFGTYASGKLLAGSVLGWTCEASVPTWFTDSPTTCPIPCWYDCIKCPTGAAGIACVLNTQNDGNAQVAWFQGGNLALAATGTYTLVSGNAAAWWAPFLAAPTADDETAISLSRNNGETWNQIALIDTTIDYFNDFAMTADCNTLYLTSANLDTGICDGFDSVWRSSLNPEVVSPLPPIPPIGVWYERVLTHVTNLNCTLAQSDLPLLRIVPGCDEPAGQIVGWAAQLTQAQLWSPDYGDYWAVITARDAIQDFAFESSTVIYNLSPGGLVQKLPYTGTSWGTSLPSVNTGIAPSHMITAMPEGQVLVGYTGAANFQVAISKDGGANFLPLLRPLVGAGFVHVAFDPAFNDNSIIYAADTATNSVYRMNVAGAPLIESWTEYDMLNAINGAIWCPAAQVPAGMWGLALAYTGAYGMTAIYAADSPGTGGTSGVWRSLTPLSGLPKPGIAWDYLNVNLNAGVLFEGEPYSLKLCGCCTMDTDTTAFALDIDQALIGAGWYIPTVQNMLWAFTDCTAKKGPALITEDKILIGCDPVSGRAQEVNLCWEQLCVAAAYDIEISKLADFTILVIDQVGEPVCCGAPAVGFAPCFVPASLTTPCAYIPAGGAPVGGSELAVAGNLECGHTYYWRVKVRDCVTGQPARSPWSEVRSFTVKAGLPVTTPYYGPQLLAPNNGCLGCPVSPASFSWSPFKETSKYKFVLATDAAMTQVVTESEVTTTAFEYDGTLNYSTNYFWRVMALEPAPSDWSATFSFMTETAPAPVTPEAPSPTPVWVWVVIAIGAILVIVTLVLIFKTRRV
jgi:hypothetical protein